MPYPAVRVIRWNAASEFVDLKLDLTKPVDDLLDGVRAAIKPMLRSQGKRNRTDKTDFEIEVFDLVHFDGMTFSQVARKLETVLYDQKCVPRRRKKIGIFLLYPPARPQMILARLISVAISVAD